jgi:hypothetical protein
VSQTGAVSQLPEEEVASKLPEEESTSQLPEQENNSQLPEEEHGDECSQMDVERSSQLAEEGGSGRRKKRSRIVSLDSDSE